IWRCFGEMFVKKVIVFHPMNGVNIFNILISGHYATSENPLRADNLGKPIVICCNTCLCSARDRYQLHGELSCTDEKCRRYRKLAGGQCRARGVCSFPLLFERPPGSHKRAEYPQAKIRCGRESYVGSRFAAAKDRC